MTVRRIFWLLLVLVLAAAFHYRQAGFDIVNLSYKFGRLNLTKQKVLEVYAGPDVINFYVEAYPKPITLLNTSQLTPIIRKAYADYFLFLEKNYPEVFYRYQESWDKKRAQLDFIFVSHGTYETLNRFSKHDSTAAYLVFFDSVYFNTFDYGRYDVGSMKPTIRHEIFHYLNNYFGLTAEFEEAAAQRFGDLP
ncbi:MAG: hypothetical protein Q8R34_01160 [bacterium]|nr:hypothetical protein [bacterium]